MAGPGLPTNVDSQYADSTTDPSVKVHQQAHDTIHAFVNAHDVGVTPSDGWIRVFNATTGLWTPVDPSGVSIGTTPTDYSTAPAGSLFRVVWNGTSWPTGRPSSRTDIYFQLYGAPIGTAEPAWLLPGDSPNSVAANGQLQSMPPGYTHTITYATAMQVTQRSQITTRADIIIKIAGGTDTDPAPPWMAWGPNGGDFRELFPAAG